MDGRTAGILFPVFCQLERCGAAADPAAPQTGSGVRQCGVQVDCAVLPSPAFQSRQPAWGESLGETWVTAATTTVTQSYSVTRAPVLVTTHVGCFVFRKQSSQTKVRIWVGWPEKWQSGGCGTKLGRQFPNSASHFFKSGTKGEYSTVKTRKCSEEVMKGESGSEQ